MIHSHMSDVFSLYTAMEICEIECHHQFYCENNVCKPRCDRFRQYSDVFTFTSDVTVIVFTVIGTLAGFAVLLISCLHRKRM